ncbi:hypothetical protein [Novosphingobium sp. 9]|uniref:hypothetical protein n=1 Tax=Novosphingobium sp. 9 TaxID=2025349 RepID=UPI0021B58199|nr:hypothetical protein [Novosphingobium sp. 9]
MGANDALADAASWVPLVGAGVGAAVAGFLGYKTGHAKEKPEYEPVLASATLSDGPLIRRLIDAIEGHTESLRDNNELLRAEAHRREVDAEVREALRARGIKE